MGKRIKGVILAGGKGTRLYPLTRVTNKHLLPVGKEPMILHPVKQLVSSGITNILIITSTEHMGDVVNLLGSGVEYGASFTYKVQDTPGGIAHALLLAEEFAHSERIIVLLGDNVFQKCIRKHINDFQEQKTGARVLLKGVEDPCRYGVAALDESHIIQIVEKPSLPPSNYAVVGCYMYDSDVFDIIRQIKPSSRGELEITSVNNEYIARKQLEYGIVDGIWTDAGTFESLMEANQILLQNNNELVEHE